MLSQKVINQILEMGFYFQDEFDPIKNEIILTQESKEWFNANLGITHLDSALVYFYSFAVGGCGVREEADCLSTLEQIIQNYQQPFWGRKYPGIEKRYLQLSSIEGEYSYFYDKETDALYGVDWKDMNDFMTGKLKPLFSTFYDFLEWYYGEGDEV